MTRGHGGVFNVAVEGKQVFSKHEEGRFPTNEEVIKSLRSVAG